MDKYRVLKKKKIAGGHSLEIVKYLTDYPKIVSDEIKKRWNPEFDGSYEIIIGLNRQTRGQYEHNTHPKLSWYLGQKYFTRIYDKINCVEDFRAINMKLLEFMSWNTNSEHTTEGIEGLLNKL